MKSIKMRLPWWSGGCLPIVARYSRRSGNPEPFVCSDTAKTTETCRVDGRLTLAIPEDPNVVERHKGLWILAAAGMTGGFNDG